MKILIVLIIFSVILVPIAMLANKVGEQIEHWLEEHFLNVEE